MNISRAKHFSGNFAIGKVKPHRLVKTMLVPDQRMKQPLALQLEALPVRNPVARALAQRAASSAAGKHIRKSGALRRAETVALKKSLPRLLRGE
jgi:hypothetical protein